MKWKRTAMSLALAGCMMATTVPVTAFAAQTETTVASEQKAEAATAITFAEKSGTVGVAKTIAVAVNKTPADGTGEVKLSSSDESVATVTETLTNGVATITGVKAGKATITAKIGKDISATYEVTVTERKQTTGVTLKLDKTALDMADNDKTGYTISYNGDDKETITWHSDNEQVAKYDATENKIVAVGTGTANIWVTTTAKNYGVDIEEEDALKNGETITSAFVKVTVSKGANHLDRIEIKNKDGVDLKTLQPKDTVQLTAKLIGVNDKEDVTDNVTVKWSSDNEAVATVDSTGKVTAVAKGNATITASAGNKVATKKITVTDTVIKLETVTLNKAETTLKIGEKETLTAALNPTNANNLKKDAKGEYEKATWKSSNDNIATVDEDGKVTAVAKGTAIITVEVTDKDNKKFVDSCKVTVDDKDATQVASVNFLSKINYELEVSQSATADKTVLDFKDADGGTINKNLYIKDSDITWTTADSSIAIVKGGKLIALAEGETTVTAKVNGATATTKVVVEKNADDAELKSLSLNKTVVAFAAKNVSAEVEATTTPDSFEEYVVWTVADEKVAKIAVDENNANKVTITSVAPGSTTVTATVGGISKTVRVEYVGEDTPAPVTGFVDVPANAWYANAVNTAAAKGLMNGTGNNKFEPLKTVQRSQVAAIVWNIEGAPAVTGTTPFTDVAADAWYAQAVTWAYQNKVVSGTSATTFAPNQNITRQDFAVVLYNKAGKPAASADLSKFVDASKINSWAQDAVKWAVSKGIINGNDKNELNPTGTLTRAEAASIIVKYVG